MTIELCRGNDCPSAACWAVAYEPEAHVAYRAGAPAVWCFRCASRIAAKASARSREVRQLELAI